MANPHPRANLAPFLFKVEFSKAFSLIHSDLVPPPPKVESAAEPQAVNAPVQTVSVTNIEDHLKIASYYALDELEIFLQALGIYNQAFIHKKKAPNPGGKEEIFLGAMYVKILPGLIRENRWSAVYISNSEATPTLQDIFKKWAHSMRRTLISTYELEAIFENHYLSHLQDLAKHAISQLKWRMLGEEPDVKRVFRQYIQQLQPFASGDKKRQEKLNLAQDALMRLKVCTESKDPRCDDVLYHVGHKIEAAHVNVVEFLEAESPDATLDSRRVARKFLSRPFNRSMTPKSFTSSIKMVESYGNNQQKNSLYGLLIFQENAGKIETTNRNQGKNRIVVPRNLIDFIPKFNLLPSIFQDVARRYDFFKDKHWLMHLMKEGIEKFLVPEFGVIPTQSTLEKYHALQKFVDKELEDIESRLNSLYSWNKKSRILFNEWKTLVSGIKTKISEAIASYEQPEDSLEAIDPEGEFDHEFNEAMALVENLVLGEKKEPEIPVFSVEERQIINACTTIFRTRSCDAITPNQLTDILKAFYEAYLAKQANPRTSGFYKACRKEANEIFKLIANHFEKLSKKDWADFNESNLSRIFSDLDLFSQVTKLITQETRNGKIRKAFPKEDHFRLESLRERVLANQTIVICKKVEMLTKNDSFTSEVRDSQQRLLENMRNHSKLYEGLPQFDEDSSALLERLNDGSNRHIIRARFASVREIIEERIAVPPPKVSSLPGIFYHREGCGAQLIPGASLIPATHQGEVCAL